MFGRGDSQLPTILNPNNVFFGKIRFGLFLSYQRSNFAALSERINYALQRRVAEFT